MLAILDVDKNGATKEILNKYGVNKKFYESASGS